MSALSELLNYNPMYYVFTAKSLAGTVGAVLYVGALVAFYIRNFRTGVGLIVGCAVSVATAIDLAVSGVSSWVTPVVTGAIALGLPLLACIIAWRNYSADRKLIAIIATLTLAFLAASMFSALMDDAYPVVWDDEMWLWNTVEGYMWGGSFLLFCTLLVAAIAYFVIHRRDYLRTRPSLSD
ncbi:MAG TPA: hypothetical protein VFM05_07680 [Candidatus Saccharimonadales bacterium]|nr:hypothetical protein [Candidatus Saccharimonadales bacterium]